jgi:hypothetical protein
LTIGVVSAGTIKFITDMHFNEDDIILYRKNLDLGPHEPYRQEDISNKYNSESREIYNLVEGNNLYWVHIQGDPLLNLGPCEINVSGIDFRTGSYKIIKKMFFLFPVDPGTPITQ